MSRLTGKGYPDLECPEYVFKALLGHGMFTDLLPPCFTSENLLKYVTELENGNECIKSVINDMEVHSYVAYSAYRNTNVPRHLGIPHPESFIILCKVIKENWLEINRHTDTEYSRCHVRKIKGKNYIYRVNYEDKWKNEEEDVHFALGCRYVVKADISICYPSIYSHAIPWAIRGKSEAKREKFDDHWANFLDKATRNNKNGETNGILIGSHTSTIISEIILTRIDTEIEMKKETRERQFQKFFRYIDDYTFYAKDEKEAKEFLKKLQLKLKEYELLLNDKKTEIIPYELYSAEKWTDKLNRFVFPSKDEDENEEGKIGYTSINSYISYALTLAREYQNYAVLKYATKVIAKKRLSTRAKRLYVDKILSLTLLYPYLLPNIEEYIFSFFPANSRFLQNLLMGYLPLLFNRASEENLTDALAYCFYYGIKFDVQFYQKIDKNWHQRVLETNDCISMLLAWKYSESMPEESMAEICEKFKAKAKEIAESDDPREKDNFWIFIYEVLDAETLEKLDAETLEKLNAQLLEKKPNAQLLKKTNLTFLAKLKKAGISFLNFNPPNPV